jgi:oxygen-independent coproporphyrinogen-3 oxidase
LKPEKHIYVHVPFCLRKCSYCSFFSVPYTDSLAQAYLEALAVELRQRIPPGSKPETLYIGGGTPTALSCSELSGLLQLLETHIDLSEMKEFTIEANPGTLSAGEVETLSESAISRISLGVQSFNNAKLEMLGRLHTSDQAAAAFESLSEAGFRNISGDLIYGVPGDSEAGWQEDLDRIVAQRPSHFSTYCLSVEPGTPFAEMLAGGEFTLPDDGIQRRLYEQAAASLRAHGYERYELSNFALAGFSCRHNMATWRYEPYVGLGPSAASFDGAGRSRNPSDLTRYLANPGQSAETERLTDLQRAGEIMMLALRTREGITAAEFRARSGLDLLETYGPAVERLIKRAHIEEIPREGAKAIRIATASLFVSNEIITEFF